MRQRNANYVSSSSNYDPRAVIPDNRYVPDNRVVIPDNRYVPDNRVVVPDNRYIPDNRVVPDNRYVPDNRVVVPDNRPANPYYDRFPSDDECDRAVSNNDYTRIR